jgi:lysophospholipase L1-like esterase
MFKTLLQRLLFFSVLCITAANCYAASITFRIDMSNQAVTSGVYLGADWNGWNPAAFNLMTDNNGDGIYEVTIDIAPGSYNYRACIGQGWDNFESLAGTGCGAGPQGADRNIVVTTTDTVLDVFCFGSCTDCLANVNVTLRVSMINETVAAQGVHVSGSFNGWNTEATVLNSAGGNIYEVTVSLSPGTIHEYKFLNGNTWGTEEIVFGPCELSSNRYFTVPETDVVLDVVCFRYCNSDCSPVTGTKIACIGDSVTWGAGVADRYNDNYPFQLRDLLGTGYAVENFGNSGKTMLINGDDPYWNTSQYSYSQLYSPDVVFIMLGSNDSKAWNYPAMPEQFSQNYVTMINAFRAMPQHPEVYAVLPPKAYSAAYGIDDYVIVNSIIPDIKALAYANAVNIIDMHQATMGIPAQFPDGVHPDGAGSGVIAAKDFTILTTPKPVISQSGAILNTTQGFGYQWYLNGNAIVGATGQNYTAMALGIYTVGVKLSETTEDFLISEQLNVETLEAVGQSTVLDSIIIYPNPGNVLQLHFAKRGHYKMSIFSVSGQVIFSEELAAEAGNYILGETERLASGLYLVRIVSEDGSTATKKWNKD